MSYVISKEVQFDAGHRVPNHSSKCKNPHGHRYRVVAYLRGQLQTEGSSEGMVEDFGVLKTVLTEKIHDQLDHGFIIYRYDTHMREALEQFGWKTIIVDFVSTAENLTKAFYEILFYAIQDGQLFGELVAVEVWETPTSMARYPG